MLSIRCPGCDADRPETEYVCAGPLPPDRPGPPETVSAAAWADYLHYGANPRGPIEERWCHRAGCGTWFVLRRDTVTHRIDAVRPLGESTPTRPAGDPSPARSTGNPAPEPR